jgi:hypothetical protein
MDMILNHGANATEIIYTHFHLFFSYQTPVAAFDPDSKTIYVTDKKYTRTTTAHIKKWISHLEYESGDCHQMSLKSETLIYLTEEMGLGKSFKEIVEPPPKPLTSQEIRMNRFDNLI